MDERSDRGEFYPGGSRSGGAPSPQSADKVDRVSLGEVGESYTLKDVKAKVNQIVRAIAPAAVCLALGVAGLCARTSRAATAPLEDIPNTAPVVTNEEDAVAMAAVGALGGAVSNKVDVEVAGVRARLDSATNAITVQMAELRSADSNRIATTYAKLSDIPAQPDLSPYALKSELPQDYLTENDITNFATRVWINSQNYAREGTVYARLDLQDLAIAAASNALWAAQIAESVRLDRRIDAIAVTGGDRLTRLYTEDTTMWQDATGVVWRVEDALGPWTATTNSVVFGSWDQAQPDMDPDLYAIYFAANGTNAYAYTDAPGNKTNEYIGTSWYWSDWYGPEAEAARFPITFIRNPIPGGSTNAVRQVAYMDEVPSTNGLATVQEVDNATNGVMVTVGDAINLFAQMGTVLYAKALVSNSQDINAVWPKDVWGIALAATNYTDSATNSLAIGPIYGLQQSVEGIGSRVSGLESYAATKDGLAAAALAATNYTDSATNALAHALPQGSWLPATESAGTFTVTTNVTFNDGMVGVWFESGLDVYNHISLYGGTAGWISAGATVAFDDAASLSFGGTNVTEYIDSRIPHDGGAPSWEVVSQGYLSYTNGMMDVHVNFGNLSCVTNGWPDGASMFFRLHPAPGESYTVLDPLRLVGYGTWPTNDAQAVAWRSGTNVYVNVILEERR